MNWGLFTLAVLMAIDFGYAIANHGKPRGNWNAGERLFDAAATIVLVLWAMHWRIG